MNTIDNDYLKCPKPEKSLLDTFPNAKELRDEIKEYMRCNIKKWTGEKQSLTDDDICISNGIEIISTDYPSCMFKIGISVRNLIEKNELLISATYDEFGMVVTDPVDAIGMVYIPRRIDPKPSLSVCT